MSKSNQNYFKANQALWNAKTPVHIESDFYDMPGFLAGNSSLRHVELNEVGEVSGKTLLHLQCHFGQDTLSWAREGAVVTGVDFSEKAIKKAREIADQTQLEAEFVQANVYDLPEILPDRKYDIVFTSYGTIGWLPDLDKWASVINHFLKPGGFFYIVEFHPFIWMHDSSMEKIEYSYFQYRSD
jgi:ubiquinone/menaquinone biosynthesis C-methylase UbiE